MNVQQRRTTVIQMLTVPIVEDRLTVHVEGGMKEMVLIVKVGTDLANYRTIQLSWTILC